MAATPDTAQSGAHLQHTAHPLEAIFFRCIGPLFCHHHNALVIKHRHRKHSNSKRDRSNTSVSLQNHPICFLSWSPRGAVPPTPPDVSRRETMCGHHQVRTEIENKTNHRLNTKEWQTRHSSWLCGAYVSETEPTNTQIMKPSCDKHQEAPGVGPVEWDVGAWGSASLGSGHWSRDLNEVRTRATRRSGGGGFRAEGTESGKVLR